MTRRLTTMDMTAVERFWAKLAFDEEYRAAFRRAMPQHPSPEELASFASGNGFDLGAEDFLEHARSHTIRVATIEDGELEDDVLDAVAGGGSADSHASAPLELDIYANWGGLDSMLGSQPMQPTPRADKPKPRSTS